MALGFTVAARNEILDDITTRLDAGAGPAKLQIYSGTRPTNADTAITTQTLLAELTLSDPSFGAASSGSMTANSIANNTAVANGTATWFRLVDSNDNAVTDGNVGTSGSDLNLGTTSITIGLTVSVSSMVLTAGNA